MPHVGAEEGVFFEERRVSPQKSAKQRLAAPSCLKAPLQTHSDREGLLDLLFRSVKTAFVVEKLGQRRENLQTVVEFPALPLPSAALAGSAGRWAAEFLSLLCLSSWGLTDKKPESVLSARALLVLLRESSSAFSSECSSPLCRQTQSVAQPLIHSRQTDAEEQASSCLTHAFRFLQQSDGFCAPLKRTREAALGFPRSSAKLRETTTPTTTLLPAFLLSSNAEAPPPL